MSWTAEEFKRVYPEGIIQGKKFFRPSKYRANVWIWVNKPDYQGKSFDYYMCSCGKIYSNCGFAKHKCNISL